MCIVQLKLVHRIRWWTIISDKANNFPFPSNLVPLPFRNSSNYISKTRPLEAVVIRLSVGRMLPEIEICLHWSHEAMVSVSNHFHLSFVQSFRRRASAPTRRKLLSRQSYQWSQSSERKHLSWQRPRCQWRLKMRLSVKRYAPPSSALRSLGGLDVTKRRRAQSGP